MTSFRQNSGKFYRINHYINAVTIRLLDEAGKQIGVMPIAEARLKSQITGLDLVEIAPKAVPPVVKLIDFAKFRYQEAKKLKAEKKGTKGGELKEIQMTPFIGQSDYDTRLKKTQKFLATGNKVKLSIKFQGRQITRKEFGYNLIDKFKNDLAELAIPEGEAKLIGKRLFLTLTPVKKKVSA
ncbi:MAG: translation initiation factor IF-3 [Candidatus Shapirobacteria bacterium]|jgi:translation initiation factor IF-3